MTPELAVLLCLLRPSWRFDTPRALAAPGPEVDWSRVLDMAIALRVMPLAASRLGQVEHPEAAADFVAADQQWRAGFGSRVQGAELVLGAFLSRCRSRGVVLVPLKGPTLSRRLYGDSTTRPFSDLDVLVELDGLRLAAEIGTEMGYRPRPEPLDRNGLPLLHLSLEPPNDQLPALELHWRLHWYESDYAQAALGRAVSSALGATLAPVDELITTSIFEARDGFQGIRYLVDLAAAATLHLEAPGVREGVRAVVEAHPALRAAVRAAFGRADRLMGTHLREVLPGARARVRSDIATRLARMMPPNDELDTRARVDLTDVLLAPPDRLPQALKRRLAPRATVEGRLPTPSELASGLPVTARRLARQARALSRSSRR